MILDDECPAPGCTFVRGHGPTPHSDGVRQWEDLRPWSGKAEMHWLYACDLDCTGCNRASFLRSPHTRAMTVEDQREFFRQADALDFHPYVTIVGGEPTLHPQFEQMLDELIAWAGIDNVQLWSNAYSDIAKRRIAHARDLNVSVCVETMKPLGAIRSRPGEYWAMDIYVSPADYGIERTHCFQHQSAICGMGVDAEGYFPCAMGGTVAAMLGAECRTKVLADLFDTEKVAALTKAMCQHCGHAYMGLEGRADMSALPRGIAETPMSPTWAAAFAGRR